MLRLPSFKYLQPKTLKEALAMKADAGPDGMYVAGGTDLYPNMKRRHQEPRTVISLMGIRELAGYKMRDAGCALGPCATLSELTAYPPIRLSAYSAVAHAAALVSTPLLRNMGTLGGNLCLDTRCNYYDQTYEWRKAIDFCMKKDGHICWVAPSSAASRAGPRRSPRPPRHCGTASSATTRSPRPPPPPTAPPSRSTIPTSTYRGGSR